MSLLEQQIDEIERDLTELEIAVQSRPVSIIPKKRFRNCAHQHVNGDRCGSRMEVEGIGRGKVWCPTHENRLDKCPTCYSMLNSFMPPGGWT